MWLHPNHNLEGRRDAARSSYDKGGMKEMGPTSRCGPHPHLGLYQATFLLGRAGHSRYRLTDKGPLPPVFVEVNRGWWGCRACLRNVILANARGGTYIPRPSHYLLTTFLQIGS